ncbi:aldehyde dehydrogenase family protein [Methanocella conradii]|uniref:aldehyde dehydrogenase family protein n=1 Tax=Methanocella conradii TaxID=1175444 RepID=UPI0024B38126|nr:aldehyde dehydrogenase family protein [Methanocella conradii]MDI6897518.1 aldehyde dehydrogenase family protein [Methanocella conradii]
MMMLIDGEWTGSCSEETYEVKNPANGRLVDTAPLGSAEDVKRAADSAHEAFKKWSELTARERGKILFRAAQRVREKQHELAVTLTMEQGKPLKEARDEIQGFANILEYYSGISAALEGRAVSLANGRHGIILRRPIGVCGAIIPWNVPAIIMGWKVGPALVTGNTLVLKPATTTPLTNLSLASILNASGLPKGVLNVVTGNGASVGEEIVRNPLIKKLSFTGSIETGRRVLQAASSSMKRVTLELGGSDPMIVCDDADIKKAVEGAVHGRFYNCGQTCTAVKRLYVFESIADEFVRKLRGRVERLKVGNGMEEGVDMGPLNNRAQWEQIKTLVDRVKEKEEGNVIAGGKVPEGETYKNGYFYMPTLVTDVAPDSALLEEEVFGPVLPIITVKGLDEAIELANGSKFGLGSSIWTNDIEKIRVACERLESGVTWVNQHVRLPPEMPFGGVKESGIGRENGLEAIDAYCELKSIIM